jgi:hypothetical protein
MSTQGVHYGTAQKKLQPLSTFHQFQGNCRATFVEEWQRRNLLIWNWISSAVVCFTENPMPAGWLCCQHFGGMKVAHYSDW